MKYVLIIITGLLLASCGNDVGRYQVHTDWGNRMIDTKTGDIFRYVQGIDTCYWVKVPVEFFEMKDWSEKKDWLETEKKW